MKILDRYIAKQLLSMIAIVTLGLLGLDLFFYFINEIRFVGRGDYTLLSAILFILMTIPRKLVILLPWAALIGTLLSLGNLASHSELIAMRSAAISIKRIVISVMKAGVVLVVVMILLSELIAPKTEKMAQARKTMALSGGQAIQTPYGTWVRNGEEFIHIKTVLKNDRLKGITRYQFSEQGRLSEVSYAKHAVREGEHWLLKEVVGTNFKDNRTYQYQMDEAIINQLVDTAFLEASGVKYLDRLSILTLWRSIQMRKVNELNIAEYELAFWAKLYKPVAILVMLFVGIPFIFGPLRSSSMGLKILSGVLLGFLFHNLNALFMPLAQVYQIPAFLAAALPMLLFFLGGCWLTQKVR